MENRLYVKSARNKICIGIKSATEWPLWTSPKPINQSMQCLNTGYVRPYQDDEMKIVFTRCCKHLLPINFSYYVASICKTVR